MSTKIIGNAYLLHEKYPSTIDRFLFWTEQKRNTKSI